tara:strand:- start:15 stop:305 length:291 start_codon:yes stop_codon:yes gene_type:complete
MSAISYAIQHGTNAADAAERTSALLKELLAAKPHLFNDVTWEKGGLKANMTGKGFKGSFTVDDQTISVDVKLGMLARPFKGKVESALHSRLTEEFG